MIIWLNLYIPLIGILEEKLQGKDLLEDQQVVLENLITEMNENQS